MNSNTLEFEFRSFQFKFKLYTNTLSKSFRHSNVTLFLSLTLLQQVDTTIIGLSPQDAVQSPYIASMGVYAFSTDVLLKLLRWRYPTSNDFGSEIIPSAVKEQNMQVRKKILTFCQIFQFLSVSTFLLLCA